MSTSLILPPGSTLGVLGSGQLGRMFAIAARKMGYRVHTFSPDDDTPTGQVADKEICAAYDDLDAIRNFARDVDVVTFEFENVPAAAAEAAAEFAPVHPGGSVLHTTQHRLREKIFLQNHGFPTARFEPVRSPEDLRQALEWLGYPAILKSADWGYDGKGQTTIRSAEDAQKAAADLQNREAVLESFVDFAKEFSLIAARGADGAMTHWPLFENRHTNHVLDTSMSPAEVSPGVAKQAIEIGRGILEELNVVGVLCVEFFLCADDRLIVNELAPRPHNSGHLTFDASATSQFEQQVRAVCGLPLGSTELLRPAAMANLLGDLWLHNRPATTLNWAAALASSPNIKLHLYGKQVPRAGRKMGHLTALAETSLNALRQAVAARDSLS